MIKLKTNFNRQLRNWS